MKLIKDKKLYTIHCSSCMRILGISIKHIQKKLDNPELYCLDCAKIKFQTATKPKGN